MRVFVSVFALVSLLGIARSFAEPDEPDFYATPKVSIGEHVIQVGIGDSLKKELAAAQPGDVIELKAGAHPAPGGLAIQRSGKPDAWIVIRGIASASHPPTIDLSAGELAITASYVLLENLEVVNGTGNNIHIVPTAGSPLSHVVLRHVRSAEMGRGTGAAVKIAGQWNNGHGVPAEQVYLEDCDLSGSRDNAVVDAVGVRRSVVRRCWIHDPTSISLKCAGIFFKGGSTDVLIEDNLISGIHGNPGVMIGGDTGAKWFDGLHSDPKVEAVGQVVRRNLIADVDDAPIEVRGAEKVRVLSNTIVTRTKFAVFRFTWGGGGSGSKIGNHEVELADNLVVATEGPKSALDDGNEDAEVHFGRTLWAGKLAPAVGPGLPKLPAEGDVVVTDPASVLANPSDEKLKGLEDARARFRPSAAVPRGVGALDPAH